MVCAGDHGVHAQGVTPWPQEVTGQMVANFAGGGAVVAGGGLSGKSPADRHAYLDASGRFAPNMQGVSEALTQEMGMWQNKRPCPFFHVNGACNHTADNCRFYH